MQKQQYENIAAREDFYWWNVGRKKILASVLKKYSRAQNERRILDIGCGTGSSIGFLKNFGQVFGVDNSYEALKLAQSKGFFDLRFGSAQKLPYQDKEFDLVAALDVLEHLEDDNATINEINRVLKDNGLALITVPAHKWLWSGHDSALEHKRRYEKNDLLKKLTDRGFVIKKQTHFVFPGIFYILFSKLLKREPKPGQTLDVILPGFLNKLLIFWLALERQVIKIFAIPFGTSFLVLAQKKATKL